MGRLIPRAAIVCFAVAFAASERAEAQTTVQQPVVGVNRVGTAVSVPDRGAAQLGRVGRAAASRSVFGPGFPRWGSSFGHSLSHTGTSVRVHVHDLHAMDRYLRQRDAGAPAAVRARPALTARAALSGSSRRGSQPEPSLRTADEPAARASTRRIRAADPRRARRFLALGERAERRGRTRLSRVHYRMAARYGSTEARRRLRTLPAGGTD